MGVELTFSVSVSGLEREWERGLAWKAFRNPFRTKKAAERGPDFEQKNTSRDIYDLSEIIRSLEVSGTSISHNQEV